jgi:WS/DGAT/MGAT family acyltransferase
MQALSGLDASFLYLETDKTPMHVAGLYILSPSKSGKPFDIQDFKHFVQSRLQVSRIFRQKIIPAPFALSHPYWIEDENFDLDSHITHLAMPEASSQAEFLKLARQLFQKKLNRNRPLWEIYAIEGLCLEGYPKDAIGMIVKVHHAAIDGGSGAEIMATFYDLSPTPRTLPPDTWLPEKVPSGWEIAQKGMIKSFWTKSLEMNYFFLDSFQKTLTTQQQSSNQQLSPPIGVMSAPRTIFNGEVTNQRVFDGVTVSLADLKKVKNAFEGVTLNDVILSICAGALRRYLELFQVLPEESLIAMCPKSVRPDSEKGQMGNRVSAMLVSLATQEANPIQRLLQINENTQAAKVYSSAVNMDDLINLTPSGLTSAVAHLYQSLKVSKIHKPFCNLTITNIVGPPTALYMNGLKLLNHYGLGPITHGMGLIIAVFSYNNQVMISATSCPSMVTNMDLLMQFITEEMQILLKGIDK